MAEFYYFLSTEQFQPEVLIKHAVLAEKAGFDGLMISEHFHPWVDDKSASGNAFSILGALAVTTKKIKLMTGVVAPLFRYHPAVIAQFAATIDRLSGGRFELGLGTGEKLNEEPLGYKFPSYKERYERMIEAIEIINSLISEPQSISSVTTFNGKYYQTERAGLYSTPISNIPMYLAAGGPKSARLAGKKTDGVITSVKETEDTIEKVVNPALEAAKDAGLTKPKIIATRWSVFAKGREEAWQALQSQRGLRVPDRNKTSDPAKLRKQADSLPREKILSRYSVAKSFKEYVDIYKPLITEIKADIVVVQTTSVDQEKLIGTLGDDVLPRLRS